MINQLISWLEFVPDYVLYAQPLYDSIKDSFDWKNTELVHNLKEHHNVFINKVVQAQELFYPDYSLPWVLQTDASISGLGGALLQNKEGFYNLYILSRRRTARQRKNGAPYNRRDILFITVLTN